MLIDRNEIISATQMVKNFAYCREKAKQYSKVIIFKNNKPDLALVDIDEFEKMINEIELLQGLTKINMNAVTSENDNEGTLDINLSK